MRLCIVVVLLLAACFVSVHSQKTSGGFSRVIYGNDGRRDTYELNSNDADLGASTAILMYGDQIVTENTDGSWTATFTDTAEDFWGFCEEEPYSQQPIMSNAFSFCSGFLLSTNPPWLGTAAHCIDTSALDQITVVFGFDQISASETRLTFNADEVYTVDRVIEVGSPTGGAGDYGIVELDRTVTGHSAYTSINPKLNVGESLTLIGHPVGLPKKTDKGGEVTLVEDSVVGGTVDSYGGNSGSPVFDSSGRLAAILVGGAQDFDYGEDCDLSNVCPGGPTCTELGEALVPICALIESSSSVSNQLGLDCSNTEPNSPVSSFTPDTISVTPNTVSFTPNTVSFSPNSFTNISPFSPTSDSPFASPFTVSASSRNNDDDDDSSNAGQLVFSFALFAVLFFAL